MKTALVTTTIHVPRILELMRKYDFLDDVRFFITGDMKSPTQDIVDWAMTRSMLFGRIRLLKNFWGTNVQRSLDGTLRRVVTSLCSKPRMGR